MSTSDESSVTLNVKTTTETHEVQVSSSATVKEIKEALLPKVPNATLEQLCLIFSGKILKDHENLEQIGLKDGLTLHLVIRSKPKPQSSASSATPSSNAASTAPVASPDAGTTTTPAPTVPAPAATDLFGLGMNMGLGGNFQNMQQQMQQQLLTNPDTMRQLMDSPMMQNLLSNPEILRGFIVNNPQMQQLIERNPEVGHMLNNPELLRQTMDYVRNPSALQELMRNHDRAVSNLEAVPGGMAALQRMYRDIQEPMMDAAQQQLTGENPFAALLNNDATPATTAGVENRDPLPNPWAPRSAAPRAAAPAAAGAQPASSGAGASQQTLPGFGGTVGGLASIMNSPGYQNLLAQMTQNPQLMSSITSSGHMQQAMQALSQNPALMDTILSSNPVFAANPQMQEQIRRTLPQMMQQMQNTPEITAALMNPRVMRAMQQIQEGMQILQQEAPALLPSFNVGGGSLIPPVAATAAAPTTTGGESTATTAASSAGGGTGGTPPGGMGAVPNIQQLGGLNALMQQLLVQNGGGGMMNQQPPEERYRTQLEQLTAMRFLNRDANLQALIASFGNVEMAIARLLGEGGGNV